VGPCRHSWGSSVQSTCIYGANGKDPHHDHHLHHHPHQSLMQATTDVMPTPTILVDFGLTSDQSLCICYLHVLNVLNKHQKVLMSLAPHACKTTSAVSGPCSPHSRRIQYHSYPATTTSRPTAKEPPTASRWCASPPTSQSPHTSRE
jgi:hypothetical protein